ncbi:MAG TPA: glycosyltransferase family 39 protein [Tepidisphaeraceae bacterium]|jgi:4-amino-4-deoxy-L-arabinose transferase-like glycosyltransferase
MEIAIHGQSKWVSVTRRPWLLFAVFSVVFSILISPSLKVPFERDEGEYAHAADLLLGGRLPYRDTFLQKPPGIFLIYAGIFLTLGSGFVAVHVGLLLNYLAVGWLLYLLGKRIGGPSAGLWAAGLFYLSLFMPLYQSFAANTEAFMILPICAAMLLLWDARERPAAWRCALIGLLFGFGIFIKQTAVFQGLQIGILLLFIGTEWKVRLRNLALFGMCAAIPFGICLAWYAAAGALPQFLDCVLWHNLEYRGQSFEATGLSEIRRALSTLQPMDMIVWVAAMIWLIAAAITWRRTGWAAWFIGGWLLAAAMGISVGGYYRGHYFIQALPPLCLGCALALRAGPRYQPAGVLLVVAAWILAQPWLFSKTIEQQSKERYWQSIRFVNAVTIGDWLKAHDVKTLYILGSEPELYHYSHATAVSRYVISNPLFGGYQTSRQRQEEVFRAVSSHKPDAIIVSYGGFTPVFEHSDFWLFQQIQPLLEKSYAPVAYCTEQAAGLQEITPRGLDTALREFDLIIYLKR